MNDSKRDDDPTRYTAQTCHGTWTVEDEQGGRWWPTEGTQARILLSADPEDEAIKLMIEGAEGEWVS